MDIASSAAMLEAKRAKKRRWKELHSQKDAECKQCEGFLRDKQYAIEQAVLRFAAIDARIKAGEIFQAGQTTGHSTEMVGEAVIAELNCTLTKWQEERQALQDALEHCRMV